MTAKNSQKQGWDLNIATQKIVNTVPKESYISVKVRHFFFIQNSTFYKRFVNPSLNEIK